jgi:hypothetical protein
VAGGWWLVCKCKSKKRACPPFFDSNPTISLHSLVFARRHLISEIDKPRHLASENDNLALAPRSRQELAALNSKHRHFVAPIRIEREHRVGLVWFGLLIEFLKYSTLSIFYEGKLSKLS